MRRALALLLPLALCAQPFTRRPLSPPARSGWAVLTLDAEAQRQSRSLWMSDDGGRPVPFLPVARGARAAEDHPAPELRVGRDASNRPTAAFRMPSGGPRTLRLRVDAQDRPWVARALLERQSPGGGWILWDPRPRPHAWQLGSDEGLSFDLPEEPGPWRLTLKPVVGRAPRLLGLSLSAPAEPWSLLEESHLALTPASAGPGLWRLTLPTGETITSLDVYLRPPAAPLRLELLVPSPERPADPDAARALPYEGALWALPALESESTTLTLFQPCSESTLLLRLPEGAVPERVEARATRSTFRLPVERGQRYWLHLGGEVRRAPGQLDHLPFVFDPRQAERLVLGAAEPDPEGRAAAVEDDRLARLLPWAVGVAVLALGAVAWRLLRSAPVT